MAGMPGMLGIPRPAPGMPPMFGKPMFGIPGSAGIPGIPGRPPGRSPAANRGFISGGRIPARSAAAFKAGAAAAFAAGAGLAAGVAAGAAFLRGLSVSTKSCATQDMPCSPLDNCNKDAVLLSEFLGLDVENASPTDHYEAKHPI